MTLNVGRVERLGSVVGGGALVAYGYKRGGISGIAMAISGAGLLFRGLTGFCPVYRQMGRSTARQDQDRGPMAGDLDRVQQGSEESFPASDPPSWSGGRDPGL